MQMYVNRETGLAPESPSDHEHQRRPSVRPGQESRVAVVARPTASEEWRREPKQQREEQQEEAATRHGHSRR